MTTGELIRQARISAGLTQKELGERAGIAEPTIGRYELGKLNPKPSTLKKIAAALNVPWYELYSTDPEEQSDAVKKQMKQVLSAVEKTSKVIVHHAPLFELKTDDLGKVIELAFAKEISSQVSANRLEKIIKGYSKLNDEGQQVAVERIHELTEIPRYKRKSTPEE